jgi:hypothetical protein
VTDIEFLYEELRRAIDGGSESMTHDDALKQISYWRYAGKTIPYGWMIEGSHQVFFGEHAEIDAKREATRIGGTCKAFQIYKGANQ